MNVMRVRVYLWMVGSVVPSPEQSATGILPMKDVSANLRLFLHDLEAFDYLQQPTITQHEAITKHPHISLGLFANYHPSCYPGIQNN